MPDVQLVVFELIDEMCGADISQVHEIIRYQQVMKVPELPAFIEGIVSLRGKVVPIIDLNKRFNLGSQVENKKTKIIVTDISGQFVGFKVNNVSEVMRISDENIERSIELIRRMGAKNYIKGIAKRNEQLITLIDLHTILDEGEMGQIKEKEIKI
jgi:purine-binding chemotaxis protein CheW